MERKLAEGPSQRHPVVSPPRTGGHVKPSTACFLRFNRRDCASTAVTARERCFDASAARMESPCPRREVSRDFGPQPQGRGSCWQTAGRVSLHLLRELGGLPGGCSRGFNSVLSRPRPAGTASPAAACGLRASRRAAPRWSVGTPRRTTPTAAPRPPPPAAPRPPATAPRPPRPTSPTRSPPRGARRTERAASLAARATAPGLGTEHLPGALCSGTGSPALGLCSP